MNIEKSIIDICVGDTNLYAKAYESAVTEDLFEGVYTDMWAFCVEYSKKHGLGPSVDALNQEFPDYTWDFPPHEPLSYYIEQLKRKHAFNLTVTAVSEAYGHLNEKNVEEAVDRLREAVRQIEDSTASEADVDWNATAEVRYAEYLKLQQNKGIDGYTTPFPTLDEATQGFHDGEFILVVARQGVGKTWLTNILAHQNLKEGLRVLYFTKEMPSRQVARRFDALEFDLSYQDLRKGSLNSFKEAEWSKAVKNPMKGKGELFIVGEESGGVSHVSAKIERHKPDIVYIDGMYLMDDDQRARDNWLKIGNISRDLKKLSKRVQVPIMATDQFNRQADNSKGDASHIAYGDIAKDADVILGLFQDEDQRLNKRMTLKVLKQREGERPEIECDWDMGTMTFNEVEESDFGSVTF